MIDIIIPAYNSHKTIKQTLLSICMQNISPLIDVYIIDDCSEKPFDYLIPLFENKIRIHLIRNEVNKGTGTSRNIGIEMSHNPYIMFVDSDDMLPSIYSAGNMLNAIEKDESDLVIGRMILQDKKDEINYSDNNINMVSGKLYSRSFMNKHNIRYNNSSKHEDTAFFNLFALAKPKTTYIKNEVYFYRYNEASVTHNDPEYLIKSLSELARNCNWFAIESEKRGFEKIGIARFLFMKLVYSYYISLAYLDDPVIDKVYREIYLFVNLTLSYEKFLPKVEKLNLFYGHSGVYDDIPRISFYDFIANVKNCIKKDN